jgi:hypothetical protein
MSEPTTRELQLKQMQREVRERRRAQDADEPVEERTHERRAERSAYLKAKLDERAESEERVEGGDDRGI